MLKPYTILLGVFLLLISAIGRSQTQETPPQDEIQVLIDVSGSMKQNDPQNLRIEATKLLINLLPPGAKVSIWMFAEKTAALTQTDAVDEAWKKQAVKATANIHSRGLYTHIEDAIQTVLKAGFSGAGKQHLLLLTDGFVDISKDIMVSADSRERIFSEWIPILQEKSIKVLTIALSPQADKELLEKLAFDTGGWAINADSAEELQRAFLKMALKAAPKDSVPLNGNRFVVDANVEEFSLLIFKKPQAQSSHLFTPAQIKIDKQTALSNVTWLDNKTYDLITVKHPVAGEWRLDAAVDADNQVMIVTDLKMQHSEVPNFLVDKDAIDLKVHFTDHENLIAQTDFLSLITVSAGIDEQPPMILQPLSSQPGYYHFVSSPLEIGKHVLKIVADGKTFQREITQDIDVLAASIRVDTQVDQSSRQVTLTLQPDSTVIDATNLVIDANIIRKGRPPEIQKLENHEQAWQLILRDLPPETETTVNFNVLAKGLDGKPLLVAVKPVKIDDSLFSKVAETETHEAEQAIDDSEKTQSPELAEEPDHALEENQTDWLLVTGIVLGVNILMLGAGFFIYRAIKNANREKQQKILEKLS